MKARLALVLLLACGAEEREPPPVSEETPVVETRAPERAIDRIASTPPIAPAALERLMQTARERAATLAIPPTIERPGEPILDPAQRALPVLRVEDIDRYTLGGEVREAPAGQRARTAERLLEREPVLSLASDGRATLRYAAVRPVAATVYFGTEVPEDPLALPRLRKQTRGERDGEVVFDIGRLLRPKYDVRGTLTSGRGIVRWRLELLDDAMGSSRVYDGAFAFRREQEGDAHRYTLLPSVRQGPFVDQVGTDRAIVSFDTLQPVAAFLAVLPEGGAPTLTAPSIGTHHEIALAGLAAGTRHRYVPVLVAGGEVGTHAGGTFATEPETLTELQFAVLSDSRSGHGTADEHHAGTNERVLRTLLGEALRHQPRAIVFVGDLVDGYTTHPGSLRHELAVWMGAAQPFAAHVPVYEVMGNHEALLDLWATGHARDRLDPSAESLFAAAVVNPRNGPEAAEGAPPYLENTYSFDLGNAHLAVVNSNYFYRSHPDGEGHPAPAGGNREGFLDATTLDWLRADLERTTATHRFVFTHEPGFPNGGHTADGMWWGGRSPEVLAMRARFFRLLAEFGVAAVFHGDEHNYSRTRIDGSLVEGMTGTVWQIVTGGAGAPYYARERGLPWDDAVEAFDPRQHLVLVDIVGESAALRVVGISGETIERVDLTSPSGG